MSAVLRDIVDHHPWANDTLLAYCKELAGEQRALTVAGTYGEVHRTVVHIAEAEQIYLSRMLDTGNVRALDDEAEPLPTVSEVRSAWRQNRDACRPGGARSSDDLAISGTRQGQVEHRSVPFSVVQALDHGFEHRNHVGTSVSTFGLALPDIGGWTWDNVRGES